MGNLLIQLFYQALLFSLKSLLFSVKCAIHFVQWKTSVFEPWPDVAGLMWLAWPDVAGLMWLAAYIQGSGNHRCSFFAQKLMSFSIC